MDTEYNFTQIVNSTQLIDEISTAGLVVPDYITTNGTAVSIFYVNSLSDNDLSTLTTTVANHIANPNYITLAVQSQINTLVAYLNSPNSTTVNTARAVIVANLAPHLPPSLMATINSQIQAIVGN